MVDNSHFPSVRPSFEHFTNIFTYMSIGEDMVGSIAQGDPLAAVDR
jgi:hypothetical protein